MPESVSRALGRPGGAALTRSGGFNDAQVLRSARRPLRHGPWPALRQPRLEAPKRFGQHDRYGDFAPSGGRGRLK
jgi:hypothetical protein